MMSMSRTKQTGDGKVEGRETTNISVGDPRRGLLSLQSLDQFGAIGVCVSGWARGRAWAWAVAMNRRPAKRRRRRLRERGKRDGSGESWREERTFGSWAFTWPGSSTLLISFSGW